MKNKSIFNRIKIGIKEGLFIQQTPNYLKDFDKLILVKIFKFLGLISTSYILSSKFHLLKNYDIHNLNNEIFYVASFISILYLFYRVFYSISVVVYTIKLFKNKQHWVINSPKDNLATLLKGGLMVIKSSTSVVAGSGLLFTIGSELDDIAQQHGRAKVFVPTIKASLEKWGVSEHVDKVLDYAGFVKLQDEIKQQAISDSAKAFNLSEEVVRKSLDSAANSALTEKESADLTDIIKSIK